MAFTYTGGGTPTDFTTHTTYAYDTLPISGATQNYSRLSSITYPDGSVEGLDYGASTSTPDSRISRATGIRLDGTAIVTYARAGLDTVTDVDYRDPAIELDRFRSEAGTTTTGHYPGLDRFGRVRRQMWVDSTFGAGSGGNPNKPPVVSLKYAYTKASDRTSAIDDRPGAGQPLSSGYEYDGLHRLVEARLGAASGGSVPVGKGSQRWREDDGTVTLDALGNWRRSWWDLDGSGSFSDTDELDARTHDVMNRIIGRTLAGQGTGGADLNLGDLQYDNASNLSLWKRQAGTAAETWTATHDAWNRLTDVSVGSSPRLRQAHNALHWRTYRFGDLPSTLGATPAVDPDGNLDQARFMHYGADWRLLEERVDDDFILKDWNTGAYVASSIDRTQQHVWGLRYIDDAVLHRIDSNKDGDYTDAGDGTWYHLTDAQFSSVCLVDPAGSVAERVSYSAYGIARHHWKGDVDGDGAVTVTGGTSDLGLVSAANGSPIGGAGYRAEYDLDRDGDVDIADQTLVGAATAALPAGQLSPVGASGPDSQAGWDGYLYSAETGLYAVRFRTYEPGLGRWMERDPAGYVGESSLFGYAGSLPASRVDPSGLAAQGAEAVDAKTQERRARCLAAMANRSKMAEEIEARSGPHAPCPPPCTEITVVIKLGHSCLDPMEGLGHTGIGIGNEYYDFGPRLEDGGSLWTGVPRRPWWDNPERWRDRNPHRRFESTDDVNLSDILGDLVELTRYRAHLPGDIDTDQDVFIVEMCVCKDAADQMRQWWRNRYADLGTYCLLGRQCTTTVRDSLLKGGVVLPDTTAAATPQGLLSQLSGLKHSCGRGDGEPVSVIHAIDEGRPW